MQIDDLATQILIIKSFYPLRRQRARFRGVTEAPRHQPRLAARGKNAIIPNLFHFPDIFLFVHATIVTF